MEPVLNPRQSWLVSANKLSKFPRWLNLWVELVGAVGLTPWSWVKMKDSVCRPWVQTNMITEKSTRRKVKNLECWSSRSDSATVSNVTLRVFRSLNLIYLSCKRNEVIIYVSILLEQTAGKGNFSTISSSDPTGVSCRSCLACSLVFSLSHQWALPPWDGELSRHFNFPVCAPARHWSKSWRHCPGPETSHKSCSSGHSSQCIPTKADKLLWNKYINCWW